MIQQLEGIAQLEGLSLEEISTDLSVLTIDLQIIVPAEKLASLLKGLADIYRIGASLDDRDHDPFIAFGSAMIHGRMVPSDFVSSQELYISQLEIGTPNKLKVTGRTQLIKDLYRLVLTFGLAKYIFFPPPPIPAVLPPDPPAITMSATEYMDALQTNFETRRKLDEQFAAGTIQLGDYMQRLAILEVAAKTINDGMTIARTKPPSR